MASNKPRPIHRPDEEIPGEILARMTKPKKAEANVLWQVFVENRKGEQVPASPMMIKEACEEFCSAISIQIAKGREKQWANPTLIQVTS